MLKNLAKRLGQDSLSTKDVQKHLAGHLSTSTVINYFGSLGEALEAAGLRRQASTDHFKSKPSGLTDDELFISLLEVEKELGGEPGFRAYAARGKYSTKPLTTRFGKWSEVLAHYRKWKAEKSTDDTVAAEAADASTSVPPDFTRGTGVSPPQIAITPPVSPSRPPQLYGEPIDFRGLRNAPINEQGVVYLFGMVSRELGFNIEALQQGFPDCEGKYLFHPKKNLWAKARIEFEFKAHNFVDHGHNPEQCDFIVCWENDWPDCPITVIELRNEILRLPSR